MNKQASIDPFPVMENMTVKRVREYLKKKRSILIPIGVIEQHGYHLPLCTDALIATYYAREMGKRTGILVAPTIHQSFSGGGLPGTINISPSVMSLVVSDTLLSLAAQGFDKFHLILAHGGSENTRALEDALKLLLRMNPAFDRTLISLMLTSSLRKPGSEYDKAFKEHDWHAGWLETSEVMAIAPELVRMDEFETDPKELLELQIAHPDNYQRCEKIVDDEFVVPRMTQRPDISVGVMGRSEKASAELGRKIIAEVLEIGVAKIKEIESRADGVYHDVKFVPEPIRF